MRICTKWNLTVSVNDQRNELMYFDVTQKRFKGQFAEMILDSFFLMRKHDFFPTLSPARTQEQFFKLCDFRGFKSEGALLPNGTFSGAIGDVVMRRSDFNLRLQPRYIQEGLVEQSNPIFWEDVTVGHYIDEKSAQRSTINLAALSNLLAPSVWFSLEYVSLYAAALLFVYLLAGHLGRRGARKRTAFTLHFAYDLFAPTSPLFRRPSAIGLFSAFSLLCFFLVGQILGNCVKTDKVVVSTEQLLDSFEKIVRTDKEICLPLRDGGNLQDLVGNGTFQRVLLEKVNRADPCYFEDMIGSESVRKRDFFFFFARGSMHILRALNLFYRKDIFVSERSFGSNLFVYYLSRSMNKRAKQRFNAEAYITPENGYKIKVDHEIELLEDVNYPQVKPTFYSGQQYVHYYTTLTDQMKLEDFTFVYLFYALWSLVLLAFVVSMLSHRTLLWHAYRSPLRLPRNVRLNFSGCLQQKKKPVASN